MTSSFVLRLGPSGSATVCRGWRYLLFNDYSQMRPAEHIREQLGYRRHWKQRNAWIHLDMRLDDNVCPRLGQYTHLVPDHFPKWLLTCLPIIPRNHPNLVTPVLACKSTSMESEFGEQGPHIVPGLIPGRWIVLGEGNGIRIKIKITSANDEEPSAIQVYPSREPIRADAWEHSF